VSTPGTAIRAAPLNVLLLSHAEFRFSFFGDTRDEIERDFISKRVLTRVGETSGHGWR
jgi:hypothetical protein